MLIVLLSLVVAAVLYFYVCLKSTWKSSTAKRAHVRTLIIVGSGGHTSEVLRSMANFSPLKFSPRCYVIAETDRISELKVLHYEKFLEEKWKAESCGKFEIIRIPRSREVRQSYLTSVFSTLWSFVKCFPIVWRFRPDLLLCNGPGTCVPVCFVAFLLRGLSKRNCSIVFMESLCRVETLSMTGLILYHLRMADEMFVQWVQLAKKYPRVKFIGRFV